MIKGKEVRVAELGPLTFREAETLLWVAEGKTAWEAGTIMGVAESTAVAHLKSAAEKLDAATRPHLVSRAFCAGILKAGTAIILILAVFLRMPPDYYRQAQRPRVRRREDEAPELIVEACWTTWHRDDGHPLMPEVIVGQCTEFVAQNFISTRNPKDGES